MKRVKKLLVAGAILAFAALGTAEAEGLSFSNILATETWYFGNLKSLEDDPINYHYPHRFPGLHDVMTASYSNEKIDMGLSVGCSIEASYQWSGSIPDPEKKLLIDLNDCEPSGYIKFRPIDILQISMFAWQPFAGSYLPVLDCYFGYGNLANNIEVLFMPINGLFIELGLDWGYIYQDYDPDWDVYERPELFLGAEYKLENIGDFSLVLRDVLNHFGIGAFAKITAVKDLNIYGSFAYQKREDISHHYDEYDEDYIGIDLSPRTDGYRYFFSKYYPQHGFLSTGYWYYESGYRCIGGDFITSLAFEYSGIDNLLLAAELITNLTANADNSEDLYFGLKAAYKINKPFTVSGTAQAVFDLVDSRNDEDDDYRFAPAFVIEPKAEYVLGSHTFAAGFKLEFCDGRVGAAIPISWTYAF